ncbi:MAG: selenium cofactor biosynthesis protein YqeC [Thermoflexales bacterium]|nr:selenium cofactor biosynthesis protein YqeC [Thermoflexales bacterium]MDW8352092.1 selenium cofactor biosynthesis protein YqeC [Anaerolineae bacterium]
MELLSALGIRPGDCVAVVGAGGKTTLCWQLTQALVGRGERVIFTTTTKIRQPAMGAFDRLHIGPLTGFALTLNAASAWRSACIASAVAGVPDSTPVGEAGMPTVQTKLAGFAPEAICALKTQAQALRISILVEADGARGLRIKAPGDDEPVIPNCADVVCVVANLDVIGQPLDERVAHRVERVARLTQTATGSTITPTLFTALLSHPQGGLKGVPPSARKVVVLTQYDADEPHPASSRIAAALCPGSFDRAVVIAPRASQPILLRIGPSQN